jgi:hypothetical protein
MEQYGNIQFHGRRGKAWINDERFTNVTNMTATVNNNFEEIPDPEGFGVVQVPNGFTAEISLTVRRDGTEQALIREIITAAKENRVPDISVVGKMERNDGKEANRYRYDGVTFDSAEIQKFEQDSSTTELELSGKFRDFEEI